MANTICGRCGTFTHATVQDTSVYAPRQGIGYWIETVFRCDACSRLMIGSKGVDTIPSHWSSNALGYWSTNSPQDWTPKLIRGQEFPDVPTHIAEPASEAHTTFSVGAVRSAVLMARSVIEAVAKDKGIDKGPLVSKIDELAAKHLIKDFTKDTAHVIRAFGNDMAHGDFSVPLDREDAEGVLDFMDLLLREVYQDPAKLAALKQRADARKQSTP